MEVVEGKGLEVNKEYLFEISGLELAMNLILSKDAPDAIRGKKLDDIPPVQRDDVSQRWLANMLKVSCMEVETGTTVTENFNVTKPPSVNASKPEFESKIIRMIKALGHKVEVGQKIKINEYFKHGVRFYAKVVPQMRNGKETMFHQLDINSIRPAAANASPSSVSTPKTSSNIPQDRVNEIKAMIAGVKTKEEAIQKIVADNQDDVTLSQFLTLWEKGVIVFA